LTATFPRILLLADQFNGRGKRREKRKKKGEEGGGTVLSSVPALNLPKEKGRGGEEKKRRGGKKRDRERCGKTWSIL